MSKSIQILSSPDARRNHVAQAQTRWAGMDAVARVRRFHCAMEGYEPTPLIALNGMAARLDLSALWIKDESRRFGLEAFKVLGAAWALTRLLADRLGLDARDLRPTDLTRPEHRRRLAGWTCITATDGNHGRAVAWAARRLGCRAVVYLPADVSPGRVAHIRNLGARTEIVAGSYDVAVQRAAQTAARKDWILVQDTSGPDYEQVPHWIMQGYLTLFDEAYEQLSGQRPTHVFLQCGVGSFAASGLAYLQERFGGRRPRFVVVEPEDAGCYFASMQVGDGRPHTLDGPLDTLMGGLSCGRPSPLAWRVIGRGADAFALCADEVAVAGMRSLGRPPAGDPVVVSGESGAVTLGLVERLMGDPSCRGLRERLHLSGESRILLVSTEGATDPETYRRLVG